VRRDDKHIVAVVLGGTSNAARDARMRQLIEEHIVRAALVRTAPVVAEINDGTEQESPPVLAVAPAAPKQAPATGEGDASAAEAKAEAVPIPKPRVLAATGEANGSKRAANTKAPTRATRLTAKASASSTAQAVYTLSQGQTRNLDRKPGSFSY
jgi:D-alanyl-D-alanine carboxypeptidase